MSDDRRAFRMNKFTVGLFSAVLSICVGFAELAFSEESANTFRRDNFFIIESSEANGLKGDRKKLNLSLPLDFLMARVLFQLL